MKKFVFILFLVFYGLSFKAQDAQLSQFYASSLYLNPAFVGNTRQANVNLIHRMQWPGIGASYTTSAFGYHQNLSSFNSGVGLLVMSDYASAANLRTTDVALMYSYNLKLTNQIFIGNTKLTDKVYLRAGAQVAFADHRIDMGQLTFETQNRDDQTGLDPSKLSGELLNNDQTLYPDISTGFLLHTGKFWAGLSAHHLNQPNLSFLDDVSPLPMKISFHTGYTIPLNRKITHKRISNWRREDDYNISITPAINYKHQGKFDQMDFGLYGYFKPIVVGVWYRGVPFKDNMTEKINSESIVYLFGIRYEGLRIGYCYDMTLSHLAGLSGGAHEVSLSYNIKTYRKSVTYLRRDRSVPSPMF